MRFIHIVSGDAARAGETPLGSASDDEVIDEPPRGSSPVASTITSSASSAIPASCAAQQDAIQLGCRHFIIHARKCLLEGLSVKENRSVPPLRYDWVFRLLDDFPALDFSLNGGVVNLGVAQELLDRRSAGRAAAARGDDRAHALQGAVAASLRGPVLLRRAEPAVRPLRGDHEVRRLLRGDAARGV